MEFLYLNDPHKLLSYCYLKKPIFYVLLMLLELRIQFFAIVFTIYYVFRTSMGSLRATPYLPRALVRA